MPADAFFIDPRAVQGGSATLAGEELRHARGVLRLGAGDEVTLLDGEGGRYRARFIGRGKNDGAMEVVSRLEEPLPALSLTLALALLKNDRFERAVQKACELGVAELIPLVTGRTEVRARKGSAREERLRRIVVSSCKQCGRARFLRLAPPSVLEALDPGLYGRAVVLWEGSPAPSAGFGRGGEGEEATRSLGEALGPGHPSSCLLVVGPEGGFSPSEIESLTARGAVPARLGSRVMRAETAAAASVAIVQYLAGDLSQGARR